MEIIEYATYAEGIVNEARIKLGKGLYAYPYGEYVRQKLGTKHGCVKYRYIRLKKPGRLLLICIRNKEGKRGGRTKAIALLRDKDVDLRAFKGRMGIVRAIKRFRKFKEGER